MTVFAVTLLLIAIDCDKARGDLALNLYGLSYHLDRRDVEGRRFNELNPGLGGRFDFVRQKRSNYFLEGGVYSDSYAQTAKYGVVGYDYRIFSEIWLGVVLGLYDSRAVSAEGSVVVAAPTLSYRRGRLKLHLVHLPEFPGINPYPSFGLYASISLLTPGVAKPESP